MDGVTIDYFMETASDEQRTFLNDLIDLYRQGVKATTAYLAWKKEVSNEISMIHHEHGVQSDLIEADLELIVDPMLPRLDAYETALRNITSKLRERFKTAVNEFGMGVLGFIQRHYEKIVGEPMPEQYPTS